MQCFYVPGSQSIIDTALPDGRSGVFGETLAEIRARYPGAELMPFEAASMAIELELEKQYMSPPTEITEEQFMHALEVLPPVQWKKGKGAEGFHMSEFTVGYWTGHYCRIGDRYFAATRRAWSRSVPLFVQECVNL